MRLGIVGRWAIRQAFGVRAGATIVAVLEAVRPQDIDALDLLIEAIRRRGVVDILGDLRILEQIDDLVNPDRMQWEDAD